MHPSTNQPWVPPRKGTVDGDTWVRKPECHTMGLHHKGKHRMVDFYRKVLGNQVYLGTCYLEIYV